MSIFKLRTRNQSMEHCYDNDVPYERQIIDVYGRDVEGVFPVFECYAEIYLDDYYLSDDFYDECYDSYTEQMRQASRQLAEEIQDDPSMEDDFTPTQLRDIKRGKARIDGLTWHHHEEYGRMELVDYWEHRNNPHTGGSFTWNYSKFAERFDDWED